MKVFRVIHVFISFMFFLSGNLYSQWHALYNSPYSDNSFSSTIACDHFGNTYIAGTIWTGSVTEDNYLIIKYNSIGDTIWTRQYDGFSGEDEISASAIDKAGNLLVTGRSEAFGNYNYLTLKYSPSGQLLWSNRFNNVSNNNDEAIGIVTDDSSNVYVTGSTELNPYETRNATVKYNSSGVQQWVNTYGGVSYGNTIPTGIVFNNTSGNIYITGYIAPSGIPTYAYILKYYRDGTLSWVRFYDRPGCLSVGYGITSDKNDNIYITGYTTNNNNNKDFLTIKYNSAGDTQWVRTYADNSNGDDIARSITLDSSGNCSITGESHINMNPVNTEIVTISYSSGGNQLWIAHYNKNNSCCDHVPAAIMTDQVGNVYVSGKSTGSNNYFDFIALKYLPTGIQQWEQRYHYSGSTNNFTTAMALDSLGNVYLTGTVQFSYFEIGTLKFLSNPLGFKRITSETPANFILSQNYPNPFNPSTNIRFSIPAPSPSKRVGVRLIIYDILGRVVATLVNEQLKPGNYEVKWDAGNYPSGVYFNKLTILDPESKSGSVFQETRKLVLLK